MSVTIYKDGATVTAIDVAGTPPPIPAPTIANLSATPASLPAGGGNVVIDAAVTNATALTLDGAPVTLPVTVPVPASHTFSLGATGPTPPPANATVAVSVAATPPPPSPTDLSWFTSKAPGSITNIGTVTLNSINPCPGNGCAWSGNTKFPAILAASGSIYVPWLGRAGMIVHVGGGHTDYFGREVMAFDLFTQAWTMLKPPYPTLFVGPNGYHSEVSSGLLWANAAGTATVPNEFSSGHTYGQVVALPANFGTLDPLGAALYTGIPSLTPGGQRHGMSCFVFEFSTNKYAPFAGPMPMTPSYSHSFIDVGRRRVLIHADGGLVSLNVDTKVYTKIATMQTSVNYMVWWHDIPHDIYVGVSPFPLYPGYPPQPPRVYVVDPNASNSQQATTPGVVGGVSGWPWPSANQVSGGGYGSDLLGGVVYYHGQGEKTVRLVTPPTSGNPRTTPWPVQVLTFAGDNPPPDTMVGAGAHCKRFMEVPAAAGALWLGQTAAPVQWWKYP